MDSSKVSGSAPADRRGLYPTVLYAALREPSYVRNLVTLRALGNAGVEVIRCTSQRRSYPLRMIEVAARLMWAAATRRFDVVVLGFLAQPLVPLARMLTRKPLVVDGFISLYDTLCFDRHTFKPRSPGGRFVHWLDRHAFRRADILVVDTHEHGEYFHGEFGVSTSSVRIVPVGADDEMFRPRPRQTRAGGRLVFYYATGLPVHGLRYVLEAARLVQSKGITLRIAGPPETMENSPPNVSKLGWVGIDDLAQEMSEADVVLAGHFSVVPKAQRTVAGKTYQALACGRPTIVSDLPANRRVLQDGRTAFFCEAASPVSIAATIELVLADPSAAERVAYQGRRAYESSWHIDALTTLWVNVLRDAIRAHASPQTK